MDTFFIAFYLGFWIRHERNEKINIQRLCRGPRRLPLDHPPVAALRAFLIQGFGLPLKTLQPPLESARSVL